MDRTDAVAPANPEDEAAGRRNLLPGLVILVVGVCTAAFTAWFGLGGGGAARQVQLYWSTQPPLDLTMLAMSVYVLRIVGRESAARRYWSMFALAGAVFAIGDTTQMAISYQSPGIAASFPGSAQTSCATLGVLAVVWAMLTYPVRSITASERTRFYLDAATVLVGAASFVWFFAFTPGPHSSGDLVSLPLEAGVLLVAVFAGVRLALTGASPMTLGSSTAAILAALGVWVITALTPMLRTTSDVRPQLVLGMLTSGLITCVPAIQARQLSPVTGLPFRPRTTRYRKLPYVAVAATNALLVAAVATGVTVRLWGILVGSLTASALVVVRQTTVFEDNAKLLDRLDRAFSELREREQRFRALVQHASDITIVTDIDAVVTYVSPALEVVLGLSPERALGRSLFSGVHQDDVPYLSDGFEQCVAAPRGVSTGEARVRHVDGSWRWLDVTFTNLLSEPGVQGIVCNAHDVTEAKNLHDQLRHLAAHDTLTSLPNRMLFNEKLAALGEDPAIGDLSILMIDIDRFKDINDTYGHHVGDAVLVDAAERLTGAVRPTDTVARLGGDEFAVLLPGVDRTTAEEIARRIAVQFEAPILTDGYSLQVSASIGIADGPLDDVRALLRDADIAMYAAKHREGRSS